MFSVPTTTPLPEVVVEGRQAEVLHARQEGWLGVNITPLGVNITPEGWLGVNITPAGGLQAQLGVNITPEGWLGVNITPEGWLGVNITPEGWLGVNITPEGWLGNAINHITSPVLVLVLGLDGEVVFDQPYRAAYSNTSSQEFIEAANEFESAQTHLQMTYINEYEYVVSDQSVSNVTIANSPTNALYQ
ncbi:hypothetical protein DPMN_165621 [Dreissena polymorpha]|uniref:Uncharacterized protein n=1 Tax=Dreissena polymorpha TaxID=45954 RepID=A0A9D4EWG4_DREPO|nr:hypothetical protein DPMN_165621 [Dreissena polymorpha]